MKNSKKLKVIGFTLLVLGLILMMLSSTVFRDKSWDGLALKPNFLLFVPGMFMSFFSIAFIFMGFSPQLAKFSAELQSETIDHAKKEITESISKTTETIAPSIQTTVRAAFTEINDIKKQSKKDQLYEAKKLLDSNLISEEEYQKMRMNILKIES